MRFTGYGDASYYYYYYYQYYYLYNHNNHKNYNFLDCDWFKKLLFFTNSLAKLLLDSLLLDSSISQSHFKLEFKLTNHIQSCNYVRASVCVCTGLLLCFWHLFAGTRWGCLEMFTSLL